MTRQHGFTLVEILVALMILAGAAIVLADTFGASAVAYNRLDNTTRAWLVASDKLVEMQVLQQYPNVGRNDEVVERHGERWRVTTRISNGPYADTRRVDIAVGPEAKLGQPEQVYWSIFSLLGKPFTPSASTAAGDGGDTP